MYISEIKSQKRTFNFDIMEKDNERNHFPKIRPKIDAFIVLQTVNLFFTLFKNFFDF